MKLYLTVTGVISISLSVYSQSMPGFVFDNNCGLWRIEGEYHVIGPQRMNPYNWMFVQTATTAQIVDVFFVDSLLGFAGHTANGIEKTTDSGFNWSLIPFNDTTFTTLYNGVYFVNSNTGWAVGGATQIRKTTNGGSNWFKQHGPPVAGVNNNVYFFDVNTGIIVGRKNIQFNSFAEKTTNGGNNWTELNASPPTQNNELWDQYWFDVNTGWICGYDILLKTTNGGQNFANLYSNIPPSGNGHIAILAIYFVNQQTGWLGAANLEYTNIYKTTNGGANWFFQNNPVSQNGWNQINDVKFISPDSGWAVHGTPSSGAIMFTSNGGTNWVMDNTAYSWYDCLHFYQRSKAWCGGSSGRMWYTNLLEPVGIEPGSTESPNAFYLYQNYPNPFNSTSKIRFSVPIGKSPGSQFSNIKIVVYDVIGEEITTLLDKKLSPGTYEIEFDGSSYSSGVYLYNMTAHQSGPSTGEFAQTRRLVLIK